MTVTERENTQEKTGNAVSSAALPVHIYASSVQVVQRKRDSRRHSEVLAGDSVTLSEVSVVSLVVVLPRATGTAQGVRCMGCRSWGTT